MPQPLSDPALDQLFRSARTYRGSARAWRDEPVSDETLREVYDLARMGPTTSNSCPARFVFVRSPEAKARLRECLDEGNVAQTMAAPVTAIVAYDLEFYEYLGKLTPHAPDARSWFVGNDVLIATAALRNGSLQGAYLILAARALGLDCGPMSGFDNARLDAAFFPGTSWRSNFLINLGHGNPEAPRPRAPRLDFEEACRLV